VIRLAEGQRVIDMMKWGVLGDHMATTGLGTNVRLLPNWKWLITNVENRCLVPLTEFCEQTRDPVIRSGGEAMLRGQAWYHVIDQQVFAVPGFWQQIGAERYFAMVTCDPNELVASDHGDTMLAILAPEDQERWLTCDYNEVVKLQRPYPAERMTVRREEHLPAGR
jgi:putative SOS response-associated peptidase YedK